MKILCFILLFLISNVYTNEQQKETKNKLSCIDDLCSLSITQDNGDDEMLMAKLISCKDQCLVSGKLYFN